MSHPTSFVPPRRVVLGARWARAQADRIAQSRPLTQARVALDQVAHRLGQEARAAGKDPAGATRGAAAAVGELARQLAHGAVDLVRTVAVEPVRYVLTSRAAQVDRAAHPPPAARDRLAAVAPPYGGLLAPRGDGWAVAPATRARLERAQAALAARATYLRERTPQVRVDARHLAAHLAWLTLAEPVKLMVVEGTLSAAAPGLASAVVPAAVLTLLKAFPAGLPPVLGAALGIFLHRPLLRSLARANLQQSWDAGSEYLAATRRLFADSAELATAVAELRTLAAAPRELTRAELWRLNARLDAALAPTPYTDPHIAAAAQGSRSAVPAALLDEIRSRAPRPQPAPPATPLLAEIRNRAPRPQPATPPPADTARAAAGAPGRATGAAEGSDAPLGRAPGALGATRSSSAAASAMPTTDGPGSGAVPERGSLSPLASRRYLTEGPAAFARRQRLYRQQAAAAGRRGDILQKQYRAAVAEKLALQSDPAPTPARSRALRAVEARMALLQARRRVATARAAERLDKADAVAQARKALAAAQSLPAAARTAATAAALAPLDDLRRVARARARSRQEAAASADAAERTTRLGQRQDPYSRPGAPRGELPRLFAVARWLTWYSALPLSWPVRASWNALNRARLGAYRTPDVRV